MKSTCLLPPDDDALWRYGIISPLLHRLDDGTTLVQALSSLASKSYLKPDGTPRQFSSDTIRDWLYRYRDGGIDALCNKHRADRGNTSVPIALRLKIVALREANPRWTTKRILQKLLREKVWNGRSPSRSAMYRFTRANGLNRKTAEPDQPVRSFEYPHFGDLWSADFLHGPKVRQGVHAHKCYLHAIIDDATRYIVAARFHTAENTRSLLDDLMLAIRRFGICKRFYTDNGAAFRSRHLRVVAARLSIALPHSPPYKPRGRGKIERFFRSVREGFLDGHPRTTLKKLNADFSEWLTEYHNRTHRSLGMSPLSRKLSDQQDQLETIPATRNIDDIFRMEQQKTIGSDGCIRMFGMRFEVPDALPKSKVMVYYLPWNLEYILVGADKIVAKPVNTIKNAQRFDQPKRTKSDKKENDS